MNTVEILTALKEHSNRHEVIFWQYCKRPNATIERLTKEVSIKNGAGEWVKFPEPTGWYLVEGVGETLKTKDKNVAERVRRQFQEAINEMPARRFAMPRTLSDLIKGGIYAGSPITPEQTTLFDI